MFKWNKTTIQTSNGLQEAITPVILTASRSTDIPAFHGDWFFNRLKEGYSVWKNPFNGKSQYIDLTKAKAVVFWSKNPEPMIARLPELQRFSLTYYFQFTLNDYENENLEKCVPPLRHRIDTFCNLATKIGKERVLWRFDPVLLTKNTTVDTMLQRIENIGSKIKDYTEKLIFSFAIIDAYPKVKRNMTPLSVRPRELTPEEKTLFAERLSQMVSSWNLRLAACAEERDFGHLKIERNRCVDPELLIRLSGRESELAAFLAPSGELDFRALKDKGQRKLCGCAVSKDIGQYDTCLHDCDYCYANTSRKTVMENIRYFHPFSETIILKPDIME